jgi:two-component system OmpR family sensor kinase
MTIRARLAIATALLIAITIALLSVYVVRTTRATLTDQLDTSLLLSSQKIVNQPPYKKDGGGNGNSEGNGGGNGGGDGGQSHYGKDTVAVLRYDSDGNRLGADPSGYYDDPDPLPVVPDITTPESRRLIDEKIITTVSSVDGSMKYRLDLCPGPNGQIYAIAMPLDGVDSSVNRILKFTLGGGAVAIAIAAAMSWLLIRNRLKPVDQMIDTAAAIGAGNLSLRAPDANPRTELGKLSGALNNMLTQIEQSVDGRIESEQRLRRFVADAAHELRTPLTSLRGYAELHRAGALENDEALANAMRRIDSESRRMQRLVEDLLLLARLDEERGDEKVAVDLMPIIEEAIDAAQTVEADRPFLRDLPAHAVVQGDPVRLRQIFDNLLTNARIHTPKGTQVSVSAVVEQGRVTIKVADRGPGIPLEDQERVFERFWRADPSRARATGGTGLGLAIVASLVRSSDGEISLESDAGKGATFTIRLPLASSTSESPAPNTESSDARPSRSRPHLGRPKPNPSS